MKKNNSEKEHEGKEGKHMRKMERMGMDIKKLTSMVKKTQKKQNYKGKMC